MAKILRTGKTPDRAEVKLVLRHIVAASRRRWPKVDVLVRGDSHYARPKTMSWCDAQSDTIRLCLIKVAARGRRYDNPDRAGAPLRLSLPQ